ncbi:phospholipidmethyltransferase [Dorcoceras hygrometricum]|uniref:Phospholipidmethyltransferase n=1 Tax=Dorcoceras hygrometricum TaxID=472368 RepID=A0A2Z7AJR6_9LAMI|nr:phospholipidmethyltransferase [Dorcoceras hygrometricum]
MTQRDILLNALITIRSLRLLGQTSSSPTSTSPLRHLNKSQGYPGTLAEPRVLLPQSSRRHPPLARAPSFFGAISRFVRPNFVSSVPVTRIPHPSVTAKPVGGPADRVPAKDGRNRAVKRLEVLRLGGG